MAKTMNDRIVEHQEKEIAEAQKMLDLSIENLNTIQGQIQAYNDRIKNLRKDLEKFKGETK